MSLTIQELREKQAATMASIANQGIGIVSGKDMKAALDFCGVGLPTQNPGRQIASREVFLLGVPAVSHVQEEEKLFNEALAETASEMKDVDHGFDFLVDSLIGKNEVVAAEQAFNTSILETATKVYIVEFDWAYGHESVECMSEESARAYPAQVRAKYPAFRFTNFTMRTQLRVDNEGVVKLET